MLTSRTLLLRLNSTRAVAAAVSNAAPARAIHATAIARDSAPHQFPPAPAAPAGAAAAAATASSQSGGDGTAAAAAAAAAAAPAEPTSSRGVLGSILYGSEKAQIKHVQDIQHSKAVGRGKYVHEMITHAVVPSQREAYLEAAEKYFTTLVKDSPQLGNVKLSGSWEAIIGAVGNFTHILEYEGYAGYDETRRTSLKHPELQKALKDMMPTLQSREHQIVSEFAFWPTSPPHDSGIEGTIFELRTYELQPGKLLEWEAAWRRGLKARQRFVEPVGAFFGQIGQLHEVHHVWQFPSLEDRKRTREQTWTVSTWAETVRETVALTKSMKTSIMVPCKWSPLK